MGFEPTDVRAWRDRDWARFTERDRRRRAHQDPEEKVRLAIALYEAARETQPGWPTEEDRRVDYLHHVRLAEILRRAALVRAR